MHTMVMCISMQISGSSDRWTAMMGRTNQDRTHSRHGSSVSSASESFSVRKSLHRTTILHANTTAGLSGHQSDGSSTGTGVTSGASARPALEQDWISPSGMEAERSTPDPADCADSSITSSRKLLSTC